MIGSTLRQNLYITALLGEGAMGAVYLAENVNLREKKYAVKVLLTELTDKPGFSERFFQEAKTQASVSGHRNIVDVVDYFVEDGRYYLVLAYNDGESLDQIIAQGALDEDRALSITADVLRGLDAAHRAGIIHRDVKPANILINRSGDARITDFGIALQAGAMRLTRAGGRFGTPHYMSPEQIRTPTRVDHRTDVYAAGVVLYEMLTGQIPFDGETEFAIEEQHINAAVPRPAQIDDELARILFKSLEKDPARRYQGCGEFLAEVEAYRGRRLHGGPQKRSNHWPLVAAAAVIGLAVSGFIAWKALDKGSGTGGTTVAQNNTGGSVASTDPSAVIILLSASRSSVNDYCVHMAETKHGGDLLTIAKQNGRSELVEKWQRQIDDTRLKMKDEAFRYHESMSLLAGQPESVVKEAFTRTAEGQLPWEDAVESDYRAARNGTSIGAQALEAHCDVAGMTKQ
jgi:serine/threonine protein kinase